MPPTGKIRWEYHVEIMLGRNELLVSCSFPYVIQTA